MGAWVECLAQDGHRFGLYRAEPRGKARAAVVVVQEIFGLNAHIRETCDRYADAGFIALAPALFDRVRPGAELDYSGASMAQGRQLVEQIPLDCTLADLQAAVDSARALSPSGRVGMVGYCWGGGLAWLGACRLDVDAAVSYYGRLVVDYKEESPRCPTLLHFGTEDALIPMARVEEIRASHPELPIHLYAADHGFNCDHRGSYDAEAAAIARTRTLALFERHLL